MCHTPPVHNTIILQTMAFLLVISCIKSHYLWLCPNKDAGAVPHLLSYFSGASDQNWILAIRTPLQKASQTRPDPVRIRAVFGTASLHQFFLDYLATRWLWKLTLWSFSSAIFDIPEIDLRLCISGPKINLSQIFWGFLRMKIRK
jgi:hypothetical protein